MDIAKELRNLKNAWRSTEAATAVGQIKDGEYVAKLSSIEVNTSKNGRLQVVSAFEIADGNESGKTTKRFDGIGDEVGISFFKAYCQIVGIDVPENIEELPDTLNTFTSDHVGEMFNIRLKTKNDYQNMYVLGIREDAELNTTSIEEVKDDSREVRSKAKRR